MNAISGAKMQRHDMPRTIATERDRACTTRFRDKNLNACNHAFYRPLHRFDPNLDRGMLPEQNVMLKIDRHVRKLDRQNRHKLAFKMIRDATELLVGARCGKKRWALIHDDISN